MFLVIFNFSTVFNLHKWLGKKKANSYNLILNTYTVHLNEYNFKSAKISICSSSLFIPHESSCSNHFPISLYRICYDRLPVRLRPQPLDLGCCALLAACCSAWKQNAYLTMCNIVLWNDEVISDTKEVKGKGKGICLESRYPCKYTCFSDFTSPGSDGPGSDGQVFAANEDLVLFVPRLGFLSMVPAW